MAKMKDVAERAGVSETTVSHVLNNTRAVAEATRRRVLEAMEALHYHGNAHARRLARGHADSVGLVISDVENPFFPAVIKSFENAALEDGFDVLLFTTNYDPERTQRALRKLVAHQVGGVAVLTSSIAPADARLFEDAGIVSVFLDAPAVGPKQSSLRIDYAKGTGEAVTYLHNLGHRTFTLLAGPQTRASHVAYRQGVERALKRHGLPLRTLEAGTDMGGGEQAVQRLLTSPDFPTAILCSNDLTAAGALRTLQRSGIRVPQDVSVVGADDLIVAGLTEPPLTTVRIPRERTGQLAFEALQALLTGGPRGTVSTLPTELVVRGSTGPLAAGGRGPKR